MFISVESLRGLFLSILPCRRGQELSSGARETQLANFLPVRIAVTANNAMVTANAELAAMGVESCESTPTPITGTELPT
jgi:hypothetical protein